MSRGSPPESPSYSFRRSGGKIFRGGKGEYKGGGYGFRRGSGKSYGTFGSSKGGWQGAKVGGKGAKPTFRGMSNTESSKTSALTHQVDSKSPLVGPSELPNLW